MLSLKTIPQMPVEIGGSCFGPGLTFRLLEVLPRPLQIKVPVSVAEADGAARADRSKTALIERVASKEA